MTVLLLFEVIGVILLEKSTLLNPGRNNKMDDRDYKLNLTIADFEQSMEMLRHYDSFHWDITKFCFGQICVVIGACWYIYERSLNNSTGKLIDCNLLIGILLSLSALFTLLCILSLLRNRTYFCKVSHYINEHRNNAIKENAFGFENKSNMWTDENLPKSIDWLSTQFLSIYLLAVCMVVSACYAVYCMADVEYRVFLVILSCLLTLGIFIWLSYLILRDS